MPARETIEIATKVTGAEAASATLSKLAERVAAVQRSAGPSVMKGIAREFGARSEMGMALKMLRGGGAVMGLNYAASGLASLTQHLYDIASGAKSADDAMKALVKSLPVVGQLAEPFENLALILRGVARDERDYMEASKQWAAYRESVAKARAAYQATRDRETEELWKEIESTALQTRLHNANPAETLRIRRQELDKKIARTIEEKRAAGVDERLIDYYRRVEKQRAEQDYAAMDDAWRKINQERLDAIYQMRRGISSAMAAARESIAGLLASELPQPRPGAANSFTLAEGRGITGARQRYEQEMAKPLNEIKVTVAKVLEAAARAAASSTLIGRSVQSIVDVLGRVPQPSRMR